MTDPVRRIMILARTIAGIELPDAKRPLIESRLAKRLRTLNLELGDYADLVENDTTEQEVLLNALTTNHTAWLREPDHFIDLARRVIPAIQATGSHRLRIWCAATATGEEPGTIAMTLAETLSNDLDQWDIAILCTDLSTKALATARAGVYDSARIQPLSLAQRQLALDPLDGPPTQHWRIRPALRGMLHFARLNLIESWPMQGPFDVIFCRNVMIYFSRETQARLVNRLAGLLTPGGTLYVGHSESLSGIAHPLIGKGPAVYASAA